MPHICGILWVTQGYGQKFKIICISLAITSPEMWIIMVIAVIQFWGHNKTRESCMLCEFQIVYLPLESRNQFFIDPKQNLGSPCVFLVALSGVEMRDCIV